MNAKSAPFSFPTSYTIHEHMKRILQNALKLLALTLLVVCGCGGPELTDQELGHVHSTVPKLPGDEKQIPFPQLPAKLPPALDRTTHSILQPTGSTGSVVQGTGATQAVVQGTGVTLPAVQPTGTTLPAVQGTVSTFPTSQGT